MLLRFLIPAAAMGVLAACSQGADEADGAANAAAFTTETAACGVEQLEPMVWGREVSSSGLKVQELRDGVRNAIMGMEWSQLEALTLCKRMSTSERRDVLLGAGPSSPGSGAQARLSTPGGTAHASSAIGPGSFS